MSSLTKASISSGVGGRPIRSNVTRRSSVALSAAGDGCRPFCLQRGQQKGVDRRAHPGGILDGRDGGPRQRPQRPPILPGRRRLFRGDLHVRRPRGAVVDPAAQHRRLVGRQFGALLRHLRVRPGHHPDEQTVAGGAGLRRPGRCRRPPAAAPASSGRGRRASSSGLWQRGAARAAAAAPRVRERRRLAGGKRFPPRGPTATRARERRRAGSAWRVLSIPGQAGGQSGLTT